ncbi:MAG: hypothetical protein ACJ77K_18030 [Bacteroidia bacterium]
MSKKMYHICSGIIIHPSFNSFTLKKEMKKEKLHFDFLSAADKVFSMVAVLFTSKATTSPSVVRVPFFPRR